MEKTDSLILIGVILIAGAMSGYMFKEYDNMNKGLDDKRPFRTRRLSVRFALCGLAFIDVLLDKKWGRIAFIVLCLLLLILAASQAGWI